MPLTGISVDGYSLCSISGNSPGLTGFSQLYVVPSPTRLSINVYVTGPTNQGTVSGSTALVSVVGLVSVVPVESEFECHIILCSFK